LDFAGRRFLHDFVEEQSKSNIPDAGDCDGGDGDGGDGDAGNGDGGDGDGDGVDSDGGDADGGGGDEDWKKGVDRMHAVWEICIML